jgi:hypothetical protein
MEIPEFHYNISRHDLSPTYFDAHTRHKTHDEF